MKRQSLSCFISGIAFSLVAFGSSAGSVASERLRILSSWPSSLPNIVIIDTFAKNVEKASGGAVSMTRQGPEVVSPLQQLEPASRGVFDVLYTTGSYHAGATGILIAPDSFKIDPDLWHSSGVFNWIDQYYQKKFNLRLLAMTAFGGYQIMLRKQPDANGRIDGRKIRGTAVYHPLINKLGGTPVVMTIGQMFPALQKGVIDGFAWPRFGVLQFKLYETGAKTAMKPNFGGAVGMILVNNRRFNALDDKLKKVLIDEGRKIEKFSIAYFKTFAANEEKQLKEKGVSYLTWKPEIANSIRKWFNQGVREKTFEHSDKKAAAALWNLARSKGVIDE